MVYLRTMPYNSRFYTNASNHIRTDEIYGEEGSLTHFLVALRAIVPTVSCLKGLRYAWLGLLKLAVTSFS